MSSDNMKKLGALLKDGKHKHLQAKLDATPDENSFIQEYVKISKELNCPVTSDELKKKLESSKMHGKLDPKHLEEIAGGCLNTTGATGCSGWCCLK